jgi:hypothetical protein
VACAGLFGTGAALASLRVAPSTRCSLGRPSATPTQAMGKDRANRCEGSASIEIAIEIEIGIAIGIAIGIDTT